VKSIQLKKMDEVLDDSKRAASLAALRATRWDVSEAADLLEVSVSAMYRLKHRFGPRAPARFSGWRTILRTERARASGRCARSA